MACFNDLPNEILEKIIMEIPERPFKTELLLLNKVLCSLFMVEQVKNLELPAERLYSWIIIIERYYVKPCPELRYRNLLNKIVKLYMCVDESLSKKQIARFISCCANIRALILKWIFFDGLQQDNDLILTSLPSSIIEISFTNLIIKDINTCYLINYMKRNTNLETLILNGNGIGSCGACALAKVLKQNTTLTNLDLRNNDISDEGVHALVEALKQNVTLTTLNFADNKLGYDGTRDLTEVLKQNTPLTHLDISNNSIMAEGAYALAKAMKENTTLIDLKYGYYTTNDEHSRIINECLERNRTFNIHN